MKNIIGSTLFIISTVIFFGCTGSPETIHINLPSRSEWKEQKDSLIKGEFKQTRSILLTWSLPANDTPPKYVQIASTWGVENFELEPDQTELVIKKSMFPNDPKANFSPSLLWFSPTFANKVEIKGSSVKASEIYFSGSYQMKTTM